MAELATLARPYAEALFDVASQGDVKETSLQVDALALIAENEQLRQFASSPKVDTDQVFDLIVSVTKVPLTQPMQNFLRMLIENGRRYHQQSNQ